MSHIGTLKNSDMFQDLSDPILQTIAELVGTVGFEEGDNIYQLGDDAHDIYLLESGRIRLSMGVGNRPESSGSVILPGSVFGWAALLEDHPRRVATATCLEDSSLGVIDGSVLLKLFADDKTAGYFVMRRLATVIARDFVSVLSV